MPEHLGAVELHNYRRRALSRTQLLRADRHLSTCGACLARLRKITPPPAIPGWLLESDQEIHLSYRHMKAYLESRLDPARSAIFEDHLSICPPCAAQLTALEQFETGVTAALEKEQVSSRAPEQAGQSLVARLLDWLQAPNRSWSYVSALALLFVLSGIISLEFGGLGKQPRSLLIPVSLPSRSSVVSAVVYATLFFALVSSSRLIARWLQKRSRKVRRGSSARALPELGESRSSDRSPEDHV